MRSIFLNADLKVATPYIHALAPRLIENLHSDNVKLMTNDTELALILESITTVEALIGLAEPQNSK
jgi:HEAT repeat-containing protein 5